VSSSAVARAAREREVHQLVRTRSRRSARQSPKHSPGAGPRTTSRHTPTRDLSTLFRALFFLQLSARQLFALDVERAQSLEHRSPRHWRAALAGGQRLGKPGARSAQREDACLASTSHARGPLSTRTFEAANPVGTSNERHWCTNIFFPWANLPRQAGRFVDCEASRQGRRRLCRDATGRVTINKISSLELHPISVAFRSDPKRAVATRPLPTGAAVGERSCWAALRSTSRR